MAKALRTRERVVNRLSPAISTPAISATSAVRVCVSSRIGMDTITAASASSRRSMPDSQSTVLSPAATAA